MGKLLYEDLTYKIRSAVFNVYNALGPIHKESIYQKALAKEFQDQKVPFKREVTVKVKYKGEEVGIYRPDFVVDDKVIVELKAVDFISTSLQNQLLYYLQGTEYKVGLLVNFGANHAQIIRRIDDRK